MANFWNKWWEYDEDGFGPDPKGWKTWFDLLLFEPPREPEPSWMDCPGTGHCHGCMTWCAWCGGTKEMCSADRGLPGSLGCDIHRKYPPPPLQPDPRQLILGPWAEYLPKIEVSSVWDEFISEMLEP